MIDDDLIVRIGALSDSHYNEDARFDECQRIHNWIGDDMDARGVDLVLHGGDWFERTSRIAERNGVADWLTRRRKKLIGVRGNHDSRGDLKIFNQIRPGEIIIEETVNVHYAAGCAIATFPWPQKAKLLAGLESHVGREESENVARDLMRRLFLGLRDKLSKHNGPRILLMHAQVSGAVTSVGQPLVGCDMEVSLEDLAICDTADLIILGHIHKPQQWTTVNGIPVLYCGSPYATSYGEVEEKGYLLAEFENVGNGQRFCGMTVRRIPTPRTSMILLEAQYDATAEVPSFRLTNLDELPNVAGADVRFRYYVDSEFADAAASAAAERELQFFEAGAVAVKVEAVKNSTTRARAPEVVTAQTIREKLQVLWNTKSTMPEPDRAERLLTLAEQIEAEHRNYAS